MGVTFYIAVKLIQAFGWRCEFPLQTVSSSLPLLDMKPPNSAYRASVMLSGLVDHPGP